jgi:hypothetical protein
MNVDNIIRNKYLLLINYKNYYSVKTIKLINIKKIKFKIKKNLFKKILIFFFYLKITKL